MFTIQYISWKLDRAGKHTTKSSGLYFRIWAAKSIKQSLCTYVVDERYKNNHCTQLLLLEDKCLHQSDRHPLFLLPLSLISAKGRCSSNNYYYDKNNSYMYIRNIETIHKLIDNNRIYCIVRIYGLQKTCKTCNRHAT